MLFFSILEVLCRFRPIFQIFSQEIANNLLTMDNIVNQGTVLVVKLICELLDHSQKPVLSKKTRKTLTCAAVLCEHSFKGVAQVLYKQVCQSLPATLEQPTA